MSRPDDSPSVFDASALRQFAAPVDLVQRRLRALADGGWDINSLFLVATDVQQLADRAAEGQLVDLGHRLYQLHGDLERILTSGDVPDRDQSDALMRHVAGLNDYTSAGVETPEFRNTVTTRRLKAVQLPEPEIDVSGLPSIGNIPHFVVPPPEFLPDDGPLDLTMRSEPEEAPSEPQLQAEDDAPDPWAAAPDVNDEPEEDLAAELDMITQAVAFDEDASHSSDEEIEALFAELDVDVAELDLDDDDSGDLTSLFEEIESDTVGAASPAPQEERAEAMLAEIDALDLGPGEEISIYVLHGGDGTTAELTGALDRTFEVQSFTDPEDFLEILGAIGPDAVIMDDAHLDRIDDVAPIVRKLRSKTHGQLPLIVFSTQRDVKVRLKLMRAGVDAFVPADLAIDQALERVRDHLQVAPADPYRVLIAEDDRSQAVFAESILKRAGMEARIEMDPFAVVTALETFHPDLILMDLHMPGCDGMELTAIIRENEAFIHTPIVFLSGEEDQDLQFDALLAGGDDFLAKPVRPKHLISAVKNRVKRSRNTLTATPEAAASPPSPVATPEPEPEPKGAAIVDRKALGARLEERLEAVRDAPDHDRTGGMVFLEIDSAYAIRRQQGLPFLESLADALEPHIAAVMRADDCACHYGDAAWCALFDGLSIGELEGKAREILGAVGRETFEIKGTRTKVSVSAGICPLSDEFETADALISTAERICTRDAEQKDARISVHRAPTRPAEGDLRGLGEAIMEALDSDGFQMVYQPIASLQGQEVDQYQCLLRLPRPGQEPVAPARVIAAAQELGMLDQIDRWVARKAIELIAEDAGRSRPLRLFVNQSGEAATGEDAADFIVETLNQHTVSGPSLILEFKLTELARSLKAVVELTRRLEANRVRFCLGHFDGSETAFRILEYFHAEFVKLRPEVAFRQLQDGQLSETVQRLHEHRSQVVVTGVEEAQLAVQLWSSGVDFIQGHFVQKPESDLTYHFAGAG